MQNHLYMFSISPQSDKGDGSALLLLLQEVVIHLRRLQHDYWQIFLFMSQNLDVIKPLMHT